MKKALEKYPNNTECLLYLGIILNSILGENSLNE